MVIMNNGIFDISFMRYMTWLHESNDKVGHSAQWQMNVFITADNMAALIHTYYTDLYLVLLFN